MHSGACRGEWFKAVAPLFVWFHLPEDQPYALKNERVENPFDGCAPSPSALTISILSKVGFWGDSPLMPLFPAWLYAWSQWGGGQWERGGFNSTTVLRKPGVRLTELISGLICPDRYELLGLAFMGHFRSIIKEVLRTICLKLMDWDVLLVTWQVLTYKKKKETDGVLAVGFMELRLKRAAVLITTSNTSCNTVVLFQTCMTFSLYPYNECCCRRSPILFRTPLTFKQNLQNIVFYVTLKKVSH